jgi:hypothetical protein
MRSKSLEASQKASDYPPPCLESSQHTHAVELIRELQAEFPHLRLPDITDTDELNWIGAFLYVYDLVLIGRSPLQLDWSERSLMLINMDKTHIMAFCETIEQRELRDSTDFFINRETALTSS